MWVRMAGAATGDSPLHASKRALADVFVLRVLPEVEGLARAIAAGEGALMAMPADAF
jgi:hypothetical protein